MRYAFISDLHANLQAWDAVLHDLGERDVNEIICLGDLVGYGPHPSELLASIRNYTDNILLGNHDAAAVGMMDADAFFGEAQDVILWTADILSGDEQDFLRSLPLSMAAEEFRCAHASIAEPGSFDYLETELDCRDAWENSDELLLFIGHTHLPAVHELDAYGHYIPGRGETFMLHAGSRYIINVGSVGMQRDGDYRASYCIFDDEQRTVEWYRIDYDIKMLKHFSDTLLGPNEQIDLLYQDYERARTKTQRFETHLKKKALLTTQDLSGLIQQFEPEHESSRIVRRPVRKIRVPKKADIIHQRTAPEPGTPDWEAKTPTPQRKNMVGLIIAGILSLLALVGLLIGVIVKQQMDRQNNTAPVVPTQNPSPANHPPAHTPMDALRFSGKPTAYAVWPAEQQPPWPSSWTIEFWYTPHTGTGIILGQTNTNSIMIAGAKRPNDLTLRLRGQRMKETSSMTPGFANHVVLTAEHDPNEKRVTLISFINGKKESTYKLPAAFGLKKEPFLFMRNNDGIIEYITFYNGAMPKAYVARRYNRRRGGDYAYADLPDNMSVLARFMMKEGAGSTVVNNAPGAAPGSATRLHGTPQWIRSSLDPE